MEINKYDSLKNLFYAWKNHPSLEIFGIDDGFREDLSTIVQNDMILKTKELVNWIQKTKKIRKKLLMEVSENGQIVRNWDYLVGKTISYYANNKKIK